MLKTYKSSYKYNNMDNMGSIILTLPLLNIIDILLFIMYVVTVYTYIQTLSFNIRCL